MSIQAVPSGTERRSGGEKNTDLIFFFLGDSSPEARFRIQKCNLTLALGPICHSNSPLPIDIDSSSLPP